MRVFRETESLIIRYFTEADFDNLFELDSEPEVKRYINGESRAIANKFALDRAEFKE